MFASLSRKRTSPRRGRTRHTGDASVYFRRANALAGGGWPGRARAERRLAFLLATPTASCALGWAPLVTENLSCEFNTSSCSVLHVRHGPRDTHAVMQSTGQALATARGHTTTHVLRGLLKTEAGVRRLATEATPGWRRPPARPCLAARRGACPGRPGGRRYARQAGPRIQALLTGPWTIQALQVDPRIQARQLPGYHPPWIQVLR
eukprot:scaffold50221_cov66-Phaeocystis_antarctica.AAC.4